MIPITKNNTPITVIDAHGRELAPTYERRARGLVKNGRARWTADRTLMMLASANQEASIMNYDDSRQNGDPRGYIDVRDGAPAPAMALPDTISREDYDALLLRIAESNLKKSRDLKVKFFDALFIPSMSMLAFAMYASSGNSAAAFFLWFVMSSIYSLRWAIPAAKRLLRSGSFGENRRRRREARLRIEVERLRALDVSSLRTEI